MIAWRTKILEVIMRLLKTMSDRARNCFVVVRRGIWLESVRKKFRHMSSPNGETEIAVTQEKGEKAVEGWAMIWRRSRTRGWFEDSHRTIGRWAKLGTSMDVCSRNTTCVNVQVSMRRGWTGRGRAHAVRLQGGPEKWGVY